MERWNRGRKMHIPDYEPKKQVVCEVCGNYINLVSYEKYIIQEQVVKNILTGETQIPRLYDAFDCPICGCQFVAKERLRNAE